MVPLRYYPVQPGALHCRHLVDDLSRRECGLDFTTLKAKQVYFNHIVQVKTASARPIFANRRTMRVDMIVIAQDQWRRVVVPDIAPGKIDAICNAVVPFSQIGSYLFPLHATDPTALYRP